MTGCFHDDDMSHELVCSVSFTTESLARRMQTLASAVVHDQAQIPAVCASTETLRPLVTTLVTRIVVVMAITTP